MLARLHETGLVPPLNESASSTVSKVELLNVLRHEELHAERERRLGRLEEEMHVVRHVAVPVQLPFGALHSDSEKPVERGVICRVDEEDFVACGTLRDVKDAVLDMNPRRARHDPKLASWSRDR